MAKWDALTKLEELKLDTVQQTKTLWKLIKARKKRDAPSDDDNGDAEDDNPAAAALEAQAKKLLAQAEELVRKAKKLKAKAEALRDSEDDSF